MSQLRVCLAEDNQDVREALKALLAVLGHEVVCDVADGEALIQSVKQTDIDLVIADLDMPLLDGLAAAELIAQQRKLPFILVSGHADAEHVVLESMNRSPCASSSRFPWVGWKTQFSVPRGLALPEAKKGEGPASRW
jgi:CheY-like chemotaxis protein